ncbi:MAG: SCP2 sterol-binding domain-containing protein [Pseudomonadota bacterium]|nr:SCP2 sterol-binding domain-containing protein [Pseudomonadota bacterium]
MNLIPLTVIETFINQVLKLDPLSLSALAQLAGKAIQLELTAIPLKIVILPMPHGINLQDHYQGQIDTTIRGAPFTLLALLQQPHINLAQHPEVQVTGDINTAQQLINCLKNLHIDWEEQVAQWFGDTPAHHLGHLLRQGQAQVQKQLHTWQLNLSEYVQEEVQSVPAQGEMNAFLNAVDTLRDDVERLEQRLNRLQQTTLS